MFVDRERELEILEQRLASDRAEMLVLYGRRRVGKTELLVRLCRDRRHVFYVADLSAEATLRAGLSKAINATVYGEAQAEAVYPTWQALFRALAEHARKEALLVVLDEFSYLAAAHPPLPSVLQRVWDDELRHTRLKLVLCGSAIGMMEDVVLGYEAPLYGRRTGQLLLEALHIQDAMPFLRAFAPEDSVRAYGAFGGTPAYLRLLEGESDLGLAIERHVLTRGAYLYDEVRFLLQQEVREPRNYFAVLEAIAGGRTRQNEIRQATGIDGVAAYLATLQDLRLVERRVPATESQPHKSRRGIYRLRDAFFRFWFFFVHPNRSLLERGGAHIALEKHVMPRLDTFTELVFEEVCEQALWAMTLAGRLPFTPVRIGGWWRADAEIDLLALDAHEALVCECKWTSKPVGMRVLRELESKATRVRELGEREIHFALFARSGFSEALRNEAESRDDLILFGLDDVLGTSAE